MLIATAGHVDHGKTALIRALTGIDTDRLPEEKQRGLTIDLGFAYETAGDGRRIGFVDVPGHERFIRNMLAGVAAIDLVLLVVAADDGPMPQTREHLAIVSLLGVGRAAVAITKIDAVAPERVADVTAQIGALLAPTPMAGAPLFPVSAINGTGITALADYLSAQTAALPTREIKGHFRLAIDRCFSVAGAGLVVTGAVFSGSVQNGDRLRLLPGGQEVRVRSIHSQGQTADTGLAGERCALNISGTGVELAGIHRGDWLVSPQQTLLSSRSDVRLQLLASETGVLKHWTPVHIHAGAGSCTGRVALLTDKALAPGGRALAQLVPDQPQLLVYGDRFVIRDQSAQRTLGGGYVIDPCAPGRGRSRPERIALLEKLDTDDRQTALAALLEHAHGGVDLARFAASRNATETEYRALLDTAAPVRLSDDVAISQPRWQALKTGISGALQNWHTEHPDSAGPNTQQLRHSSGSGEIFAVFSAVLQQLIRQNRIIRAGTFLRLPDHRPQLSAADQALFDRILEHVQPQQLKPPALKDLAVLLELERDQLGKSLEDFARRGLILRISPTRFFHPAAMSRLTEVCHRLSEQSENGLFDVRGFRDAAQIGRNAAVEILEYFDRSGVTQRIGDYRRLHPQQSRA